MAIVDIEDELVIAKPRLPESGFTYTLTSRLGQMLTDAEKQFGERDKSFTILGIEFREEDPPQIWFPCYPTYRHIIIQLTIATMHDSHRALSQLAHEVIHLLDPVIPPPPTNNLEEGLATRFQEEWMRLNIKKEYLTNDSNYASARDLVKKLLDMNSNAVRELRQRFGVLGRVRSDQIRQVCPGLDTGVAQRLAAPFPVMLA